MTYRIGILPAAGKAVRFGGVLKELLPLPNGLSFLYETYLSSAGQRLCRADRMFLILNPIF